MILPLILLVAGFILLIFGADKLVKGASSIANQFGISPLVIGLTIVAFGTSAPEMVVNIFSAINGAPDIAIGNIVGSNMANILLILGVGATIRALQVKNSTVHKEIPFALLAMVVTGFMVNDVFFDASVASQSVLSRIDGLVLICFFCIFLYYTYGISKVEGDQGSVETYSKMTSLVYIVGGLVGLIIGGKWIVDSAVFLAQLAGLSEGLIGLTIVAVGTSLPELATTIAAVRKGETDIAIGNIVGSNIFNVFWILGITAVIAPLPFNTAANTDVLFTIVATILLFLFMYTGKKHALDRKEGVLFLLLYVGYIIYAVLR